MTDKTIETILIILLAVCLLTLVMSVAILGKMTWVFILQ